MESELSGKSKNRKKQKIITGKSAFTADGF
jgi:hypothetical protein